MISWVTPHLNNQPVLAVAGPGLDSAALAAVFPIFLSRCSQNFPVAGAAAVSHAMVRICVMTWILILMRPLPAVPKISLPKFQPLVRNVQARVPQRAAGQQPVLVVAGEARSGPSRVFSRLSAPVRPVRVWARQFLIPAAVAGDRAGLKRLKICL